MMELKELVIKTLDIFEVKSEDALSEKIFDAVKQNNTEKFAQFRELVGDLSIDWLQMIYQYYLADRKEKMQDYTPKSLGTFMAKLAGFAEKITDMCAGSGALTIQKWNANHEQYFELYEFDENVIPFLLFNMAVRNIKCIVYHSDVLKQEIYHVYRIDKGKEFGTLIVSNDL